MNIEINEMDKMTSITTKNHEVTTHGNDKIQRYDWQISGAPGELRLLDKNLLNVNQDYQRDANLAKVRSIARDWSWVACGAIVLAHRDGLFWVIDGQHRVLAAQYRSDITTLPCIVFQLANIKSEAQGFIALNIGRKPVTSVAKQKALVVAGDEVAIFVQQEINRVGLVISETAKTLGHIQAVAWCNKRAAEDKESFSLILHLSAEISLRDRMPVRERLLDGLLFIHRNVDGGITEKRILKRIREKGADVLFTAANKAAAYYGTGGAKVWGEGMLAELNRGMVNKFEPTAA